MMPATFRLLTARTMLAPFRPADAEALLAVFRDPGVRDSLLDGVDVTAEWMAAEIEASQRRFARFGTGLWAVRRRGQPDLVGFAGFREFFDPPDLQLLYGFLPSVRGQGLATEVTERVCDYAFRELGRAAITATVNGDNPASIRVTQHLGMEPAGWHADGARDFAVARATWFGAHSAALATS